MRISDWSSDVCSSDLYGDRRGHTQQRRVRMTSESRRDPLKDHLLTPETSAFIIIDYQPIQVSSIRSMDQEEMVFNIVSTAKAAVNYKLPIVHSTANVQQVTNQPQTPEIQQVTAPHPPQHPKTT